MLRDEPMLKHAKDRDRKDWSITAFDLLSLSYKFLHEGADSEYYEYVQPLADAAGILFEISGLMDCMEELYRRIESI
jgi:hypothetical protein